MRDPTPSRLRWLMIGLAFSATVLNYVHRLSFTYLAAHHDLRPLFSDRTFGLMGAAFFIAYTISNGLCGFAIDRLGTRVARSSLRPSSRGRLSRNALRDISK